MSSFNPQPVLHAIDQPAVIYAIGDIHGCIGQLLRMEELILKDAEGHKGNKYIITLGDHIDRGTASPAVIERLMGALPAGFSRFCLKGNHEEVFLKAYDDPREIGRWLDIGGSETLAAYGIDPQSLRSLSRRAQREVLHHWIPREHVDFIRDMPDVVTADKFVFVHAGLRAGVPILKQSTNDLHWIREPFLSSDHGLNTIVVHGHTPKSNVDITPFRIGVDTGAYRGAALSAVRLGPGTNPEVFSVHPSE